MKTKIYSRILIAFFSLFILGLGTPNVYAQKKKKDKVRLTVNYVKNMNGDALIKIKAAARINRQNVEVPNIELTVNNITDEGSIKIGSISTDNNGLSNFKIENFEALKKDENNAFTFKIVFKGDDNFNKASKSISILDANLITTVEEIDSKHYLKAVLTDANTNEPIVGETVSLQVKRLFQPLLIGGSFHTTDKEGTVIAQIDNTIPGIDGVLTLQAVLDSEEYHKIISSVDAKIGVPIVQDTSFDERNLWSPAEKTPIPLLIFINLMLLGVVALFLYLTINLIKISKS